MARKRISEYKAKSLLSHSLKLPYTGIEVFSSDDSSLSTLNPNNSYVVKVDEGVKKRFKKGLVKLDVSFHDIPATIDELSRKGYSRFIVEVYQTHQPEDERYISFERQRSGIVVFASQKGGVDIEDNQDSIRQFVLPHDSIDEVATFIGLNAEMINQIIAAMETNHVSFLEINPLVTTHEGVLFLDLAVEVDSAGEFFVQSAWSSKDFVGDAKSISEEEKSVDELSAKSQASFKLNVLNPDGSIFMLLSGGGASIVLADEAYNQGKGTELANYGEYSGNPQAEETYLYTKQILRLLLKSKAQKKVLIIAGGVANFTDIRVTFKGIIKALDEVKKELQESGIKVFVRRGGPYQEEGLKLMKEYLKKENLLGIVSGPDMVLTDIVHNALDTLK